MVDNKCFRCRGLASWARTNTNTKICADTPKTHDRRWRACDKHTQNTHGKESVQAQCGDIAPVRRPSLVLLSPHALQCVLHTGTHKGTHTHMLRVIALVVCVRGGDTHGVVDGACGHEEGPEFRGGSGLPVHLLQLQHRCAPVVRGSQEFLQPQPHTRTNSVTRACGARTTACASAHTQRTHDHSDTQVLQQHTHDCNITERTESMKNAWGCFRRAASFCASRAPSPAGVSVAMYAPTPSLMWGYTDSSRVCACTHTHTFELGHTGNDSIEEATRYLKHHNADRLVERAALHRTVRLRASEKQHTHVRKTKSCLRTTQRGRTNLLE